MGLEYVFPLKQHIGKPSKPIVHIDEPVKRGQLIASAPADGLGANIFSSICGTVTNISQEVITINESETDYKQYLPLTSTTPYDLIKESGLVGLGGAGFPTYAKLNCNLSEKGIIAVNAAECEPILSHNMGRIIKSAKELLKGLFIVMDILHVTNGVIAIKKTHTKEIAELNQWIETLMQEHKDADYQISIHQLEDMYPMGEERAIVREVTGKILPIDALPTAADMVVINAETVYRIYEAVTMKKPLIDKDMTVAGKLVDNGSIQIFYDIPIGIPVKEMFLRAGGLLSEYGECIMGGPFTGKRTTLDAPIVKTTGGLIASEEFIQFHDAMGLLVCACGADEERLSQIAQSMGSKVVGIEYCKQAHQNGNSFKCENPGHCPGQAGKIIALKKAGAKAVLISNCTDCTNTVMSCAPNMKLAVYHCTDGALRSVNHKLIRKMK